MLLCMNTGRHSETIGLTLSEVYLDRYLYKYEFCRCSPYLSINVREITLTWSASVTVFVGSFFFRANVYPFTWSTCVVFVADRLTDEQRGAHLTGFY